MASEDSFKLALAQHHAGHFAKAEQLYRLAVAAHPAHAAAWHNLGLLLQQRGALAEAIAAFRAAVATAPQLADAHHSLGNALLDAGELDAGIAELRAAIAIAPARFDIYSDLGTALLTAGRMEESLAAHREATRLRPDSAEALTNLGLAQIKAHDTDSAISTLKTALKIRPTLAVARYNLGNALKQRGRLDDAIASYRRAIADAPGDPVPHDNLIFAMYAHPAYDQRAIHDEESRWRQRFADLLKPAIRPHDNDRDPDRPLRVAYLSPDFYDHAHSFYLLPLLAHHDCQQVRAICYSGVARPDALTARFQSLAAEWRDVRALSDARLAELIRQDHIDIAIDTSMHLAGNRLLMLARKPAPVQVTWLAYTGGTGLDAMDYRLTDPHLDPPGGPNDSLYAEESVRLPETFWCYDPIVPGPPVSELPALHEPDGRITFGCFNSFAKVNDVTLTLWAGVLRALPRSRMIILCDPGSARQRTLATFRAHGVAEEHIEFVPRQPRTQYLLSHHRVDAILDTFPYNGHTTSFDALWMGVPVVSLCGDRTVARGALSQMTNLGLADRFVARSPADFTRLAVQCANDLNALADLRSSLRDRLRASPLMDAPRFARHFEHALRAMWRRWCARH